MFAELQNAVRPMFRIMHRVVQGTGRSCLAGSSLAIAIATLLGVPAPASGQSVPKSPTLCAEENGDCDSSGGGGGAGGGGDGGGGTAGGKKWNPGHYLRIQGNHAQANTQAYLSSVTTQLAKTQQSPVIRGAQVAYAWGTVEPTLGNYDWGPIYEHLNYLSSRGKKMILAIQVKCFGDDCTNLVPAQLAGEVFVTPRVVPTQIVEIWEEQNMDRYIALWQALAAEFDGNPDLEMILGAESTPSLGSSNPTNYTKEEYATQLKRMYSAQADAFRTTNVIANVNFLGQQVSGLIEHAFQVGAGRGLPDVFDSAGSLVFRGECSGNDCGVRDYRRLVPHFGVVSSPTLSGKHSAETDTPGEVIEYGVTNSFTHYAWVANEDGEDSLGNIIGAINDANPDAHTACPTAYAQGCQ